MSELGIVLSPAPTVEGQLDIIPPMESEIVSYEVFLQKSTKPVRTRINIEVEPTVYRKQ